MPRSAVVQTTGGRVVVHPDVAKFAAVLGLAGIGGGEEGREGGREGGVSSFTFAEELKREGGKEGGRRGLLA